VDALRSGDLSALKGALHEDPTAARSAQVIIEAGRLAWTKGLDLLLKQGADPNAEWRGYRPLHALIQEAPHKGHDSAPASRVLCLKWLLARGADPEQLGGWPSSRAIITAAFVGEVAYVDELRDAGAAIDGFVAAALGDVRRVEKVLLKDPAFVTARDSGVLTALHCAAGSRLGKRSKKSRDALVAIGTLLIDAGADVNATARSWSHDVDAVYFAAASEQLDLFELLLQRGANPYTALASAVWRNNNIFADVALRHGAKIDQAMDDGKPLLNQMVRWGQLQQALWLLGKGASPDIADDRGWTAVHQAASRGNEKMMKAVLNAGGNPLPRDREGNTPVDIARAKGYRKLLVLMGG
jgi:ankyrin repeat protein